MTVAPDVSRITAALSAIPAHNRDLWIRMGMAVKSELGETGFDIWDSWSKTASNYTEPDTKTVWRSLDCTGGVTVGSLFHEAQQRGFQLTGDYQSYIPTLSDIAEREHKAREAEAWKATKQAEAATTAQAIWEASPLTPVDHPHLRRKGIQPHGVRVGSDNQLIVPVRIDEGITSLQFIDTEGRKRFLSGGIVKAGSFSLGDLTEASTILICEGYATGASLFEATDLPVVVAFSANNLLPVAKQLRQQYPKAVIVLCGDNDVRADGKSNTGLIAATAAAKAIGGIVAIPDVIDSSKADWNDVHVKHGLDAVRVGIDRALKKGNTAMETNTLVQESPSVAGVSGRDLDEWPDISPIKTELLPVEPLKLGIIPAPLRPLIKDVSDRMQCPPDYVAAGMLVMISSIIGAGCGIFPKKKDDWMVIPNLWGGVVGRPSTMKTPAMSEAMKPMDALTMTAKQEFDLVISKHLAEMEAFKARREAIVGDMKSAAKGKDKTPSMDCLKDDFAKLEEPKPPVWRRYVTNDATIEKMAELQATNPRGLMLFRDELVGLFATWDKDGHEADRTFYMEGWNGDRSHTSDRIGRGTTHVENLCVSLFGGIQPTKLTSYLHAAMRGLNNDGLVQRLQVLVYPDELPAWELVDRPANALAKQAAFDVVKRLSTMDFRQFGAHTEEGQTPYFRFTDEAQEVFNKWLTELEGKLRTDEEPVLQEHFGKYRSLMPSLALQFHLLNLAHAKGVTSGQVTTKCTEQAAAWCEYLESHARRIYGLVTNRTAQAAVQLGKRLKRGDLPMLFTARDVYRKEWSLLGTEPEARNACEELVSFGWLREKVTPPAFGQRGKTEYETNPKVRA